MAFTLIALRRPSRPRQSQPGKIYKKKGLQTNVAVRHQLFI
jgi:hypothetical protein